MLEEIEQLAQKYAQTFIEFESSKYYYMMHIYRGGSVPDVIKPKFKTISQAIASIGRFFGQTIINEDGILFIDNVAGDAHFVFTTGFEKLFKGKIVPLYKGTKCEKYLCKILKP